MLNAFFNSSIVSAIKLGNNSISKIFLGNNLVFRDPPNCPEGQILDPVTGDCYYNFSAVTPTGLNVTLNPFAQQETGTSLGLSVAFQEVTVQGTTTIREFPSASNPTTDFKGIQIDTTCSFVGDINLTFILPNNISLIDFNKISVYNLIDSSDLTLSRDYASKTIQAKISYIQTQELNIMSGSTTNKVVLTPTNQADCDGNDSGLADPAQRRNKFHVYWKYWGGIFGGWEKCCRVVACLGDGNEFKNNDECNCKCDVRQDVCNNFQNGTWTCMNCTSEKKIFYPSSCECQCPNTCGPSSQNYNLTNNCNCECKPNRAKCGSTTVTMLNGFSYVKDTCCEPGEVCINGECKFPPTCADCVTNGTCSISTTNWFIPNGGNYQSDINPINAYGDISPIYGTGTWKTGWPSLLSPNGTSCGFLYTYSTKSGCVWDSSSFGSCRKWRRGSRVYMFDCENQSLIDITNLALNNAQEILEVQECDLTFDSPDSDCPANDPPVMVPPTLSCNP